MGRKIRDQSACNHFLNFRTYRYLGDIFFGFPNLKSYIGYSLILTAVFFRWAIEKGLLAWSGVNSSPGCGVVWEIDVCVCVSIYTVLHCLRLPPKWVGAPPPGPLFISLPLSPSFLLSWEIPLVREALSAIERWSAERNAGRKEGRFSLSEKDKSKAMKHSTMGDICFRVSFWGKA